MQYPDLNCARVARSFLVRSLSESLNCAKGWRVPSWLGLFLKIDDRSLIQMIIKDKCIQHSEVNSKSTDLNRVRNSRLPASPMTCQKKVVIVRLSVRVHISISRSKLGDGRTLIPG